MNSLVLRFLFIKFVCTRVVVEPAILNNVERLKIHNEHVHYVVVDI